MGEARSDATTLPPAGLLRAAAKLVERAMLALDTRQASACRCCNRTSFKNPRDKRVYDRLSDTPERLKALADKLDGLPSGDRL